MKIDFSKKLVTLDGIPLKKSIDSKEEATLKDVTVEALLFMTENDKNLQGEEKNKRSILAMKINPGNTIEISIEEASLIKKLIGNLYGPLIVGQAWEILEG